MNECVRHRQANIDSPTCDPSESNVVLSLGMLPAGWEWRKITQPPSVSPLSFFAWSRGQGSWCADGQISVIYSRLELEEKSHTQISVELVSAQRAFRDPG